MIDVAIYHAMWESLHARDQADLEWLQSWLDQLPKGTEERRRADHLMHICPPRFDDFPEWARTYHACVTFSLGKRMTYPIPSSLRRQIANLKWSKSRGGRSGRCGSCVDRRIR